MLIRRMFLMWIALLASGVAFAAGAADVKIEVAKPGATATVDRVIEDGKVLVSVLDSGNKPLLGLNAADFSVTESGHPAKVISAQPISESLDVPRHIVLVLDNSLSMDMRNAVPSLLDGVGELLKTVRPIDDVQIVVFSNKKVNVAGRNLRVQTFKSNQPAELQAFVTKAYKDEMTGKTMLYDAMLSGLEIIGTMPAGEPRFMVVFTDGEDTSSSVNRKVVLDAAQKLGRFNAFAIDFMPGTSTDPYLSNFASQYNGQIWKAESATNIVSIFQGVASRMLYYYVVAYQFPLTGTLAVAPTSLNIEEIKTIDSSPMLGYIFFAPGSSDIAAPYVRFGGPEEKAGFDEQKLTSTMDKYYQDLNIIGKRLDENKGAAITLVGCNDNTGKEKGNKKLSSSRAEAVRDYLQSVWGIAPERMAIQVRNLPAKPSSIRLKEGQAENRRVEILSTDPAILAPIRSTYFNASIDTPNLTLRPEVVAPQGIADWKITAVNGSGTLDEQAGKGNPARECTVQLGSRDLKALAGGGDITVKMELTDSKGQSLVLAPEPVKVNFIQTSQRVAEKKDQRVQEKYALILFDFDKDTIEAQNQEIVNKIVERIKKFPQSTVEIVGHTDNIGKEAYNKKLSERRALAVYKMLTAAYGDSAGERIRYSGVGSNAPLFDNQSPEGRSFNRTVTITLEYLSTE